MKKLCVILAAFVVMLSMPKVPADNAVTIYSTQIDNTGHIAVYGAFTNQDAAGKECAFIILQGALNEALTLFQSSANPEDRIAYIDQQTIGNNGAFLIECVVAKKFMEQKLTLKIGSAAGGTAIELDMPKPAADLDLVASGGVIYGLDAYMVRSQSQYLNAKTITESIIYGGNNIYYKLGGKWFDLKNPAATDSSYILNSANAVQDSVMNALRMRYYYRLNDILEF